MTERGRTRSLAALAVLLALGAYLNGLRNPFVYDDVINVVRKQAIRDLSDLRTLLTFDRFRPVVNVSYALDHTLWGLDPLGYHLTNLALHALNVLLLFGLARVALGDLGRLRGAPAVGPLAPFAVAALFAVHPLNTEAVGYISGRAEVLCSTFFFAAFWALRVYLERRRRRTLVLGLALLFLGLGAKEHMVMLPLVLLAYDRLLLAGAPGEARARLRRLHLPLVAAMVTLSAARAGALLLLEYPELPRPIWQNLLMQFSVIWRYILLLLLPLGQAIVHQVRPVGDLLDPLAVGAGGALLVLLVLAALSRRAAPLVTLGAAWFFLLLAPSSSVIPLVEPMAEHRVYLASAGFFFGAVAAVRLGGAALGRLRPLPRALPAGVLGLVLAALTLATVTRNRVWADPEALWQEARASAPGVWAPYYALGDLYRQRGDCDRAIPYYRKAIEILPMEIRAHINLGICLAMQKKDAEAIQALGGALKIEPDSEQALNNLGLLARRAGDLPRAREHFERALRKDPGNPVAHLNLGLLAQERQRWEEAEEHFKQAAAREPSAGRALNHLSLLRRKTWAGHVEQAKALMDQQKYKPAALELRRAIAAFAGEPRQFINLAFCLTKMGNHAAAETELKRALTLDPRNVITLNNLGLLARGRKDLPAAMGYFRRALAVAPDNILALQNLGLLADLQGQYAAAAQTYGTLLGLDGNQIPALKFMARHNEQRLGRPGEALDICYKIKRLAPDDPDAEACIRRLAPVRAAPPPAAPPAGK